MINGEFECSKNTHNLIMMCVFSNGEKGVKYLINNRVKHNKEYVLVMDILNK